MVQKGLSSSDHLAACKYITYTGPNYFCPFYYLLHTAL